MDGKISSGRARAVGKFQIRAATAAERWVLAFSFCIQCAWANMHMYLFTQGERAVAGRRRAGWRAQSSQPQIEVNANSVTAHLFANGSVLLNTTEMQEKRRNAKSVPPPPPPFRASRDHARRRRRRCWLHVESSGAATIRLFARLAASLK